MIIALTIFLILNTLAFGVLFYFLDRRHEVTALKLQTSVAEINERLITADENAKTLRANDDILAKDIETLLHEFKNSEKKAKRRES